MHTPDASFSCMMRKLQIQVLTRDGQKNIYETDRSLNVADLKKSIGRSMNVPMSFSRLTYKGRLLANDSILEDEGVKRMSTLELYWQPLVLTPKQYREKELELDKLEQIAENYEQMTKKGSRECTPSGLCNAGDHLTVNQKPSDQNLTLNLDWKIDECVEEEELLGSASSEDLDFLAGYWWCSKTNEKKSHKPIDPNSLQFVGGGVEVDGDNDVDGAFSADNQKVDATGDPQSSVPGTDYASNELKDNALLEDLLEQRCNSCKHQPFRSDLRLAANRMSRITISNIRKNQKNCKK